MSLFFMNIKRGIKGAFKTVKSNFKEYLCFFIALIMVHALFGVMTIAYQNNQKIEESALNEKGYSHHLSVTNFSVDTTKVLSDKQKTGKFTYEISKNGQIQVTFKGNVLKQIEKFKKDVLPYLGKGASLEYSPLYEFEKSKAADRASFITVLLIFLLLSFLLLTALFKIRINHFKFTYSIYLTCGGRFKKLLSTSFYEILLIVLLSFFPGLLLSYGIGMLLYLPFKTVFGFYPLSILITLVFPLIASVLALILPIKFLSRSAPVKLMKAEDNSNWVSSPKKSRIFLKKNVFYTEFVGLWRFRKYIGSFLLSTVSFAILLNVGGYIADVYKIYAEENIPEFSVDFEIDEDLPFFEEQFKKQAQDKGLSSLITEKTVGKKNRPQSEWLPHIAIPESAVSGIGFTPCPYHEGYSAAAALEILPFDKDALECFDSIYQYEYVGNPEKLLTSDSHVIVSSTLANSNSNKLQPGDTVYIPVDGMKRSDLPLNQEDLSTFDMELQSHVYTYRPFTVAAVITNYANYSSMLVYLPSFTNGSAPSAYADVMGSEPHFNRLNIHLSVEEDAILCEKIIGNLLDPTISYSNNLKESSKDIERSKNFSSLILVLSSVIFAISPLIGFFSQTLFYEKRHLEFDVMQATGSQKKHLRQLFATDAVVFTLLSGIFYTLGTYLMIHLLCLVLNTPFFTMLLGKSDYAYKFEPQFSLVIFFTGLALTLLFSLLEVLYSKHLYTKTTSDHIAKDFAESKEFI